MLCASEVRKSKPETRTLLGRRISMKLRLTLSILLALCLMAGSSVAEESESALTPNLELEGPESNLAAFDEAIKTEAPSVDLGPETFDAAPVPLSCSAQATCHDGSTRSCNISGSGTCTAVNAACPNQSGKVSCGSTTIYCPSCPSSSSCNSAQCHLECRSDGYFYGSCATGTCRCIGS